VVASQEQLQSISQLNKNISIIPDIHFEIESMAKEMLLRSERIEDSRQNISFVWEGFGYTLKNLKSIAKPLDICISRAGVVQDGGAGRGVQGARDHGALERRRLRHGGDTQ
jgi:hypothetical protein